MIENPPGTLVIRAARTEVLLDYIARFGDESTALLTSSRDRVPAAMEILEAPVGPMRWRSFSPETRTRLRKERWKRVVLLHNGGPGYWPIYLWLTKLSVTEKLAVMYSNGRFESFRSIWHLISSSLLKKIKKGTSFTVDILFFLPFLFLFLIFSIRSWLATFRKTSALKHDA